MLCVDDFEGRSDFALCAGVILKGRMMLSVPVSLVEVR